MRYEKETIIDFIRYNDNDRYVLKFINKYADGTGNCEPIHTKEDFNAFVKEMGIEPADLIAYTEYSTFHTGDDYFVFINNDTFESDDRADLLIDDDAYDEAYDWWIETYGADKFAEEMGLSFKEVISVFVDNYGTDYDFTKEPNKSILENISWESLLTKDWDDVVKECNFVEDDEEEVA